MSNQIENESAITDLSHLRVVEMAPTVSTSTTSDVLLRRIATLLFILVAGLLAVFGYFASSICITVVLSAFLAILFDPVVVQLERLRLPRGVAAAAVVLAGMGLIGLLGYELYGKAVDLSGELPAYTLRIQQAIEPLSRKIQKVQQNAGSLTTDVQPAKKVSEVRLQESPTWPAYLVRVSGVGVGRADYRGRGSVSNVFHAVQQEPSDGASGCAA